MASNPTDPQRAAQRQKLIAARLALPDRLERAVALQNALRVWLIGRRESSIGAYWPIKGEFDPLPALYRWSEGAPEGVIRRIGLPVADRVSGSLRFHVWYPGCPMEEDAYGIPKPKDTEIIDWRSAQNAGATGLGFSVANTVLKALGFEGLRRQVESARLDGLLVLWHPQL